jgi:hypothetical protein
MATGGDHPMKSVQAATNESATDFGQGKHFLIWIGLWIVALLALFPR